MTKLNPHDVVEAARDMAGKSCDLMTLTLSKVKPPLTRAVIQELLDARMRLVMDCYLTGAAEMLKRLHGDTTTEPWEDDYNHEARLSKLLREFGLRHDS